MDGIRRVRSNHKRFGVFACELLSSHPLTAGASSSFKVPHSRWNGLPESELADHGYEVLTRAEDVDVDTFVKQDRSLFVFVQGHPEYESNTLLLEYRRDVGRYLRNESDTYPLLPLDYFDRDTEIALTALQQQSGVRPAEETLAEVSKILESIRIDNTWHSTAANTYRNWLQLIRAQKQQSAKGADETRNNVETKQIAGSIPDLIAPESTVPIAVLSSR
jgi:homoserine O-succinyltransferase